MSISVERIRRSHSFRSKINKHFQLPWMFTAGVEVIFFKLTSLLNDVFNLSKDKTFKNKNP